MKILAIDDNRDNLTTLKAIVQDALPACTLLTALNGPKGIELALAEDPDVILLDIVMPDMDGYDVCRRLKADEQSRSIPVVFLTALRTDRESRIKALDSGADGFLAKPVDEQELIAKVRAMAKVKAANCRQRMENEQLTALVAERTRQLEDELAERKLAEELLRASELKRRRLFETMSEGVFYQLADGQLVDVNSAALRMFGLSQDEFLGRTSMHSAWNVIREDGTPVPGHEHPSMQALISGKPVQALVVGLLNPQTKAYTWVSASAIPEFREGDDTPYQVVVTMHDITKLKRAEQDLRESQAKLQVLIEQAPIGVVMVGLDKHFLRCNEAFCDFLGYSEEELKKKTIADVTFPADVSIGMSDLLALIAGEKTSVAVQKRYVRKNGTVVWGEVNIKLVRDDKGQPAYFLPVIKDITNRKCAESQLAQAQKMESVGRLAGGVAHDFNNMLMGIMNYAELCRDKLEPDHPIREWLNEITADAERSAKLTHQLLAFARKQIIAPKVIDINDAIGSMLKLLRRLIGEDIVVNWRPGIDVWPVKLDPVQLDQILANFAVNARDAIGGVGSIVIETGNATFNAAYCADHPGSLPGDYALLTFTDSGCGMDEETLKHIFEPFFTTKGEGEGTGLGLATVYGIVKQNNGFINVYSEPGQGTTFRIYLPRLAGAEVREAAAHAAATVPRGNETVLLVEDEKSIRITTDLFLKTLGYTVLVAENPKMALSLADAHSGEIDLLITDVIMPGMSGRDLADQLMELRPPIQCLFISGFTADVIAQRGILNDGVNFLSKPFGRDELARKVREVLDEEDVASAL